MNTPIKIPIISNKENIKISFGIDIFATLLLGYNSFLFRFNFYVPPFYLLLKAHLTFFLRLAAVTPPAIEHSTCEARVIIKI